MGPCVCTRAGCAPRTAFPECRPRNAAEHPSAREASATASGGPGRSAGVSGALHRCLGPSSEVALGLGLSAVISQSLRAGRTCDFGRGKDSPPPAQRCCRLPPGDSAPVLAPRPMELQAPHPHPPVFLLWTNSVSHSSFSSSEFADSFPRFNVSLAFLMPHSF